MLHIVEIGARVELKWVWSQYVIYLNVLFMHAGLREVNEGLVKRYSLWN